MNLTAVLGIVSFCWLFPMLCFAGHGKHQVLPDDELAGNYMRAAKDYP